MILVGQLLEGFCRGCFGRNSYEDKRVEAVGVDWIVARDSNSEVVFAYDKDIHEILEEDVRETLEREKEEDNYKKD